MITTKVFLKKFNNAPMDDEELATIASEVEGKVGQKANAFLEAYREFNEVLDEIDFERG